MRTEGEQRGKKHPSGHSRALVYVSVSVMLMSGGCRMNAHTGVRRMVHSHLLHNDEPCTRATTEGSEGRGIFNV